MTPLGFSQALADDLATLPVVAPVHAQLGEVIIPCAGTYVSILNQSQVDVGNNCDKILLADVSATIARECANVANDDGSTNWPAQDAISTLMDGDGDLLWDWAEKMLVNAWWRQGSPSISYSITGGVAITTLGVQLPVP